MTVMKNTTVVVVVGVTLHLADTENTEEVANLAKENERDNFSFTTERASKCI